MMNRSALILSIDEKTEASKSAVVYLQVKPSLFRYNNGLPRVWKQCVKLMEGLEYFLMSLMAQILLRYIPYFTHAGT